MSDDLQKRGKPDQDRINVNEEWERKDWAKDLGVSEDRLRELVKVHGPMVKDVKKALGKEANAGRVQSPPAETSLRLV